MAVGAHEKVNFFCLFSNFLNKDCIGAQVLGGIEVDPCPRAP